MYGHPVYYDGEFFGVDVDPNDLTKEELVDALDGLHAVFRSKDGHLSVHYTDSKEFEFEPPDDASPEVRAEHERLMLAAGLE